MRLNPAGIEISERTTGITRPMSTDHVPYWVNQSLALLTSLQADARGFLSAAEIDAEAGPPSGDAVQGPGTKYGADGGPDDCARQTQGAACGGEAGERKDDFGRDGREDGFEGDGQGHADTADGFHQHDQPVGDGADQAGFGGGADGRRVGRKNSGGCHGKTHRGHCPKVFQESEA